MTGRHAADGAWDTRTDAQVVRALREWYSSLPMPPVPAAYEVPTCPCCDAQSPIDYGSKLGCGGAR